MGWHGHGTTRQQGDRTSVVVEVVCVTTIAVTGDILIGGSPVGGSSTNNYTNTRVLSQSLLLPAHTIGNENECTGILAHVPWWYAIVAGNWTMHWLCGWNKFRVAIWCTVVLLGRGKPNHEAALWWMNKLFSGT